MTYCMVGLPCEHIGHAMPPLGIWFFENNVTCPLWQFTPFILGVQEGQELKHALLPYTSPTMPLWQLAPYSIIGSLVSTYSKN